MSLKLGQASREAERGWSLRSVMREIEEEGANARCLVREEREGAFMRSQIIMASHT